jgi:hypothetical protein
MDASRILDASLMGSRPDSGADYGPGMDPMTRWEAAAITARGGRPRPGTGRGSILDLRDSRPRDPTPEPASDSLLVPLDAWNRMLNQLGNLHEAGRELAEARERAAKAETEAHFLRSRVTDLRERLEAAERTATSGTVADEPAPPKVLEPSRAAILVPRPLAVVRAYYAGWRARRGRGG